MELSDVRCLAVLGLRRSGRPAALLARRQLPAARIVALDEGAPPDDDTVEVLEAAGIRVLTGPAAVLPEDAGLLVKSPGVPDSSAAVQECPAPRRPAVERGRVRLPLPSEPRRRHHRHQRQDHDHRADGRHLPGRAAAGRRGRQHRACARGDARRDLAGRGRRGRALQLPARAHRALPAGCGRATQPDRGPPRPSRHHTAPTWTPSCASSRTRSRATSRSSAPTTTGSSPSWPPAASAGTPAGAGSRPRRD